jgi:antitoxin component of MazEF toxin-antitoxin module
MPVVRVRKSRSGEHVLTIPKKIVEKLQLPDFMAVEIDGQGLRYRPVAMREAP